MTSWTDGTVALRRCDGQDWPLLYRLRQDAGVMRLFDYDFAPPLSEARAEEEWALLLSAHEDDGRLDLAICVGDEPVGMVSLVERDARNGAFTAPIFVLPGHQRRGYARRALQLLLAYAFDERRLHKFQASVLADNAASVALHRSLGCEQEGCFHSQVFCGGQWHDELWFGLTEARWRTWCS